MGSGHPPLTDRLNHTPSAPHHHHHHFTSWLRNQKGLLLVLTKSLPEARAPPTPQGQAAPSGTSRSIKDRASDFGSDSSRLVSIADQLVEFLLTAVPGCVQASQPHSLLSGAPLGTQAYRFRAEVPPSPGGQAVPTAQNPSSRLTPHTLWLKCQSGPAVTHGLGSSAGPYLSEPAILCTT